MRPSLSQSRTLLQKSVSDRRVRTSPNKHNSGERKSRPCSTESAVNPFLPVHSGRATPTRRSDSICQEAKDCFQDTPSANIPDTLVAATLQSKCPSEVPVPQIYRACIKRSPFTRPFSSSCALFSTSQSHSKYPVSPDQSPDSIFLPTTVSTTQSHLAQAALAAVQGAVADELARLSDTDNRHFSLPHLLPSPSNLISPTKAVCLDVQFANGLRVLREGVIRYRRCSKDAFRRAQAAQSSFGLNNTVCTWFGSCNALDTFRERPNNRTKLSVSFSGSSHIDHQTCCEYSGQLGPHVLTPSPSHSASRVSFTSFVLDLPSFCSSSTASSSSLSVSDAPSSSSTAQSSLPVRCTASSHTTKQTYSVPESGKLATVAGKRSLVSWFHRLITARHDPRAKLCWGVLVQSDASRSPAFLVLFKLHPSSIGSSYCLHDVSTRATVDIPTQAVVTTDKQSSGASTAPKSDDERLRVKAYTPEMFSTSRCRVLAIDTAIMDHRSAHIPSVIIVDVMGLKHKPYRLLSATANSYTMPCAEQQYNTLAAVRSHVRGELLGVLPKSESVNSSRPDATLRVPRAKWYRSPNALKSFRRLWPTTWMAMRRLRSEKSNKSQTRSPQTTPTSQVRNLNSANLDQTSTETHPVWLPLLTLFPDELA
ncbi:hypothetical protein FGIG_01473 [Fasciola gigantica]|uniref:Uncharacterized protein n=1 Tax=Fasciola gigantica TaxID=46835 RepID=A0A504YLH7_FASGI|nr:hypothetical protein FGIG_01473 [Fasciola gigantica]